MELDEFIKSHSPALQRSKLEPHQPALARLRELGYSWDQLCAYLLANGVKTARSNLIGFMARRQKAAASAAAPDPPAPASPDQVEGAAVVAASAHATTSPVERAPATGRHGVPAALLAPSDGTVTPSPRPPKSIREILTQPRNLSELNKAGREIARKLAEKEKGRQNT